VTEPDGGTRTEPDGLHRAADGAGTPEADEELSRALRGLAARDRILVALDFDGTLAPIVANPADARPLPRSTEAITALVDLAGTSVVVVSGRPLEQLRRLVHPGQRVGLVGSHGAEIDMRHLLTESEVMVTPAGDDVLDEDELQLLAHLRDAVAAIVAEHPGTQLEEKPTAVVLHTRQADRGAAIGATGDALQGPGRWPGVHVMRGKEVVELAVTDVTKGRAVRRVRARLGLHRGGVLYAGDDATDERAFAVLDDDAGDVTVKVGAGRTAARHRVAGPLDLAELLVLVAGWRCGR